MEFWWKTDGFGENERVFTHALYTNFKTPEFLNEFSDYKCYKDLIMDSDDVTNCIGSFHVYAENMKTAYKTENFLITYDPSESLGNKTLLSSQFELLEVLINYESGIKIQYSTYSDYFKAVKFTEQRFPEYKGDLIPFLPDEIAEMPLILSKYATDSNSVLKITSELNKLTRVAELLSALYLRQSTAITKSYLLSFEPHSINEIEIDRLIQYESLLIENSFRSVNKKSQEAYAVMAPYKVFVLFNPLNERISRLVWLSVDSDVVIVFDSGINAILSQTAKIRGSVYVFFNIELESLSFTTVFITSQSIQCDDCSKESKSTKESDFSNKNCSLLFSNGALEGMFSNQKYWKVPFNLAVSDSAEPVFLASVHFLQGPVLSIAESEFSQAEHSFLQLIFLPTKADGFAVKFYKLTPSELKLTIDTKNLDSDWVFTFDNAEFISRRYRDSNGRFANNFPITSGIFFSLGINFLHIYPKYSLWGKMENTDGLELLISNNAAELNKNFDINHVENELFISIHKLERTRVWREYLMVQHPPLVFKTSNDLIVSLNGESGEFSQPWPYETKSSVLGENKCQYVSRIWYDDDVTLADIIDFCGELKDVKIQGLKVIREVSITGNEIKHETFYANGEKLRVEYNDVIDLDSDKGAGEGLSCWFKTYEVQFSDTMQKVISDIVIEQDEYSENIRILFTLVIICFASSAACCIALFIIKGKSQKKFN